MSEQTTLTAPSWAKAAIVAELHQDQSDIMTDYFHHTTTRTLILAWSKHERDLFPEMRKAAALAPETAHLGPGLGRFTVEIVFTNSVEGNGAFYGPGQRSHWHQDQLPERGHTFGTEAEARQWIAEHGTPEDIGFEGQTAHFEWKVGGSLKAIEHREKYSMGSGYYLKGGGSHGSGWAVKKQVLYGDSRTLGGEDRTQAAPPGGMDAGVSPEPVSAVTVREGARPGYSEVVFPGKPDMSIRNTLKAAGYRWSRRHACWYGKTEQLPAGLEVGA